MTLPTTYANSAVLDFYQKLPFNIRETVQGSAEEVQRTDHVGAYPVLRPLLKPGLRVLDVGCGTGWFSNSLAYHHRVEVTGLDFNPVAIERARRVASELNVPTEFHVGDLFLFEPKKPFDLVISLGVLHHTDNCLEAVRHVCEKFPRPGGHVFIGLYHAYGRKPLLDHFQSMKNSGATEEEMLERYRQLHSKIEDETMLLSWFRDQVLHPHETQHTLEEIVPVLEKTGLELVSTSINRFQPFASLQNLFEQEKTYYGLAKQRLEQNEYFTGFFVFLARKTAGLASGTQHVETNLFPETRKLPSLDTKPYVKHHPVFGYHYIPNTHLHLSRPGGGSYYISINSDGIRSDRNYSVKKPPGVRRIMVLGDSMAAGQFITNSQRFSELLERRLPNLEVINLALEGSGTDQQVLLYEHEGLKFEHDLVLLLPFLQNVRRNMVEARESIEPATGRTVLRPKPRFELTTDGLVLKNVPVPEEISAEAVAKRGGTDVRDDIWTRIKTRVSAFGAAGFLKKTFYTVVPWEPFPEYKNPQSPEWQLMSALVRRCKDLAGDRPLILAPTFYSSYVRYRMARNYWRRYAELADKIGVEAIDLLVHFRRLGAEAVRCFQDPYDMHFSAYGHIVLADALESELTEKRLLD